MTWENAQVILFTEDLQRCNGCPFAALGDVDPECLLGRFYQRGHQFSGQSVGGKDTALIPNTCLNEFQPQSAEKTAV